MQKIKFLLLRYREVVSYLFFGALTTLVNMVGFRILRTLSVPVMPATAAANVLSILFAYFTNRRWVFQSRTTGAAALREFASFFACRLATLVLDVAVTTLGVRLLKNPSPLWEDAIKLASNVIIIIANYIFSKLLIFRKTK